MNPVGKAFVRVYSRAFSNQCLRERGLQYEREEDDSEKEEEEKREKTQGPSTARSESRAGFFSLVLVLSSAFFVDSFCGSSEIGRKH